MDTITSLRKMLADLPRGGFYRLAEKSGVPYNTIRNIAKGICPNPRIGTVEKLNAAMAEPKKQRKQRHVSSRPLSAD